MWAVIEAAVKWDSDIGWSLPQLAAAEKTLNSAWQPQTTPHFETFQMRGQDSGQLSLVKAPR